MEYHREYRAYSGAFSEAMIGRGLFSNNKMIMPTNAAKTLGEIETNGLPLMFKLTKDNKEVYCGVQEFTSEPGLAFIPSAIMQTLGVNDGDIVSCDYVELKKGTFIKFKPITDNILEQDVKSILENELKNHVVVSKGQIVNIEDKYIVEIVECKPSDAICVNEADIEFEFDLDEIEERKKKLKQKEEEETKKALDESSGKLNFGGSNKLGGKGKISRDEWLKKITQK